MKHRVGERSLLVKHRSLFAGEQTRREGAHGEGTDHCASAHFKALIDFALYWLLLGTVGNPIITILTQNTYLSRVLPMLAPISDRWRLARFYTTRSLKRRVEWDDNMDLVRTASTGRADGSQTQSTRCGLSIGNGDESSSGRYDVARSRRARSSPCEPSFSEVCSDVPLRALGDVDEPPLAAEHRRSRALVSFHEEALAEELHSPTEADAPPTTGKPSMVTRAREQWRLLRCVGGERAVSSRVTSSTDGRSDDDDDL